MAEVHQKQQHEFAEQHAEKLKYLAFVQVATVHALMLLSCLYNFAKKNSGPLKSGVQTVEGTVKTVIGPIYDKFHDVPLDFLKFVDNKVEGLIHEAESYVPPAVKGASNQALSVAQWAPAVANSVASEVQRAGIVGTAAEIAKTAYEKVQPSAMDLYVKYEPIAKRCAVSAWMSLNRLPVVPEVAHVVIPTAAHCSEKYNAAVQSISEHGYTLSAYLPLIPTEQIAKVFGEVGSLEKPHRVDSMDIPVAGEQEPVAEGY